jgi:hypothetical protein
MNRRVRELPREALDRLADIRADIENHGVLLISQKPPHVRKRIDSDFDIVAAKPNDVETRAPCDPPKRSFE